MSLVGGGRQNILVFGWGAAAEVVLRILAAQTNGRASKVCCISHVVQAKDCNLQSVCEPLGFGCYLLDSPDEVLNVARTFEPTLIISASYRKKIGKRILELCKDSINFHPSLLPRHRGCWSGFWSIFEGDVETGVTCHRMVENFDSGRILHQEHIKIGCDDTSYSLYQKLLPVTGACAQFVLQLYFESGLPEGSDQEGEGSYHFRTLPFDGLIQPDWSEDQVERFIRAMYFPPFDGAAMLVDGQRLAVESLAGYHKISSTQLTSPLASECQAGAVAALAASAASAATTATAATAITTANAATASASSAISGAGPIST